MAEKDPDLYLPILPEDTFDPIPLDNKHGMTDVRKADIELFNHQLAVLAGLFQKVYSVKTALELHDRIMEMIPKRRALMGYEYGFAANKGTKTTVYEPVD